MRATKTWIVVANGERARILEREGVGKNAHTVITCRSPESAGEGGSYQAPLGRVHESYGTARHQLEPTHSAKTIDQRNFAKTIAKLLETAATKKRFDRLVIIAASSMLGILRQEFCDKTLSLISEEFDKDVVSSTDEKVTEILQKRFA